MSEDPGRFPPAPPFVLGVGLLLWGWQTGLLLFALPMAMLLELPNWIRWRWPVSDREFNTISDVSGLLFFLLIIYIFLEEGASGIYDIVVILPFVLYVLVLVQLFSERGTIRPSALFISLRRLDQDEEAAINRQVDLSLPYLLLCIISASAGNLPGPWFFILSSLLLGAVLWSIRPGRYPALLWLTVIGLVLALAYGGQMGLRQAQRSIESMVMQLFDSYMWRYRDPDRASTAIGSLARLKQSDRIQLRVEMEGELEQTLLLREASYSTYGFGIWSNINSEFRVIEPDPTPGSWTLQEPPGRRAVAVSTYMPRQIGIIPVPHGTTRIHDVAAIELNRNRYGAVKMEIREGWIRYRAEYREGTLADDPPNDEDLFIPERYRPDFARLAGDWGLSRMAAAQALETVQRRFHQDYRYTLDCRTRYPRSRYLHDFLFVSRAGHCEYFATATVLVLRSVGIPARYAVGYAVDEYSSMEGSYVARDRDAHSWALAYVDGTWQVVDSTPPVWAPLADENASLLTPMFDLIALLKYRFLRWQSGDILEEESDWGSEHLLWLLPALLLYLVWRLYRSRVKKDPPQPGHRAVDRGPQQGADSPLYDLVSELEAQGYRRRAGETLAAWFRRLDDPVPRAAMAEALDLHYRYRFDPDNPAGTTRQSLHRVVRTIRAAVLRGPAEC